MLDIESNPISSARRLSSPWTFCFKKIVPTFLGVFSGSAALLCLWKVLLNEPADSNLARFFLAFWSVGFLITALRWYATSIVDEVWLAGDLLLVRDGGFVVEYAVADITGVVHRPLGWGLDPEHIEVAFRTWPNAKDSIRFIPPWRFTIFPSQHPLVIELKSRFCDPTLREAITADVDK